MVFVIIINRQNPRLENPQLMLSIIHDLLPLTFFTIYRSLHGHADQTHDVASCRKRVSAILQGYMRCIYSIYDNVLLGVGESIDKVSEEEIEQLLSKIGF